MHLVLRSFRMVACCLVIAISLSQQNIDVRAADSLDIAIGSNLDYPGRQIPIPVSFSNLSDSIGFMKMRFNLASNLLFFWSDSTLVDTCYECIDSLCQAIDTSICTVGTGLIDLTGARLADFQYVRAIKESPTQISVTAAYTTGGGGGGAPILPYEYGTLLTLKPIAYKDCSLLDTLWYGDFLWMIYQPAFEVGEYYLTPSYEQLAGVDANFGYVGVQPPLTYSSHGDVTYNGVIDVVDIVSLQSYTFGGGDDPCPICSGDINCNSVIDIVDVTLLINYVFRGGAAPCYSDDCTYF